MLYKSPICLWITEMPLAFWRRRGPTADPGQDDKEPGLEGIETGPEGRDVYEENWKEGCMNQP